MIAGHSSIVFSPSNSPDDAGRYPAEIARDNPALPLFLRKALITSIETGGKSVLLE